MIKRKGCKLLSAALAVALLASALTGCGNTGDSSASNGSQSSGSEVSGSTSQVAEEPGEVETINVTYFSFNKFDDIAQVEAAVNEITEPEIGVHVELNCLEGGQFMSQQTMLLSGGEDVDLIVTPVVPDAMNSGAFVDTTDLMNEYGQGIQEVLGDNINACMYRGCLYGVPSMHEFAKTPMIIYNKDMADELGLDMSTVKTLEDMDPILAKVVEAYPDMSTPLYTSNSGGPLSSSYGYWDTLGDNLGVIMYNGDPDKVVNLYETQEYKDLCTTLHDFSQKGYLNPDAAVLNENYWTLVSADMTFADVISQHELIAKEYIPSTGVNMEIIPLGDAYKTSSIAAGTQWHIMSTSEKQVSAMKLLNLLYTNAEVEDLICNGIEGQNFQVTESGKYDFLEGQDAMNNTYYPNIDWVMPNGWLAGEWVVDAIENYGEQMSAYNDSAKESPAFGFTFDTSVVSNQMTACTNVVKQYCVNVEENGQEDVDAAIAELNQALKSAGLEDIIQAKQEQYDEFLAQK